MRSRAGFRGTGISAVETSGLFRFRTETSRANNGFENVIPVN